MRRPTTRDGVIVPRVTLVALLTAVVGGVGVSHGWSEGWWLLGGGAVGLVTAVLVAWRLLYGALIASPLWVVFVSLVVAALPGEVVPGSVAGWIAAAGVLLAASIGLVASGRSAGAVVAGGCWSTYAGLVLRALPDGAPGRGWWPVLLLAGLVLCAATAATLVRARSSSRGLLRRLSRPGRHTDGMASAWELWTTASARALRKNAAVLRPSVAGLSRRQRRKLAATEFGTRVAKVGPLGVWSPLEDVTLRVGGPRTGKTGELCGRILDAPGAVIATSTRTDIIGLTRPLREQRGPIYVFNPSGLAGADSTITFDPLQGCTQPQVVAERASDLIAGVGSRASAEGERWDTLARQALTAVMHAAALGGHSMQHVQNWIANPTEDAKNAVLFELRNAKAQAFVQMAVQFFDNNPNTRSSISTTIMPALAWLTVPTAAAAAAPGRAFDVARLLQERGTVYLLGAENAQTAPLVTALTAHIAREARAIAARQPGGRLDPALTLALDEAALICLIPLDRWTADMGGANITIHISAQSRAQLRQRFGEAAAGAMISNAATILVFGGTKDTDDLNAWSLLTGDREEDVSTRDRESGSSSVTNRRVAVLTPAQIAQLKPKHVLIISRAMPVSIGRVQMAWNRSDVRKVARQAKATAMIARWSARRAAAQARLAHATVAVLKHAGPRALRGVEWMTRQIHLVWTLRHARAALKTLHAGRRADTPQLPTGNAEREREPVMSSATPEAIPASGGEQA